MATEIKIPVPDQTTEEVRIVAWKKSEGETVSKDEVILEVETDKSVIEVEAIETGTLLKHLYKIDDMVSVGQVVGFIGQPGEQVTDPPAAPATSTTAATPPPAAQTPPTASGTPAAVDATEIKIPIPDQTTEEVRIVAWKKSEGETVSKDEIILEVETDKSVVEVEAVAAGTLLKHLYKVDDMVPVGQVVGFIGEAGTVIDAAPAAKPASPTATTTVAETPAAPAASVTTDERIKASPIAKKMAAKLGVDLGQISGSGPNGRILRDDVEQFAAQPGGTSASGAAVAATGVGGRILASPNARRLARELNVDIQAIAGSGPNGRILGTDVETYAATAPKAAAAAAPAAGQPQPGTSVQLSKMRRAIGMNLQMSSRDTPHFNVTMSIHMSHAMEVRKQLNEGRPKEKRISVNDLIVRACALALKQYPAVNSRLDGDTLQYLADINIGIATAIESGLVVPVMTNTDQRNWDELAVEAKRLAGEARNGKIIGAGKGTFTVSNLGMFGVDNFTAIINPPESAILAVGAVKNEVVDIGNGIGLRPMMKATLCSDHRIIDGALAAQFLQCVKVYLEEEIEPKN